MGRGVALQFKNAFPENYRAYRLACDRGEVQPGKMFVFENATFRNPRFIINFPTKRHWRSKSRIEDIELGLVALAEEIRARDIQSIALPPLASGLGGLNWSAVKPRIEATLSDLSNVDIIVFEPGGPHADARPNASQPAPHMTPASAALIGLMDRYLRGLLEPFVTLLEIHKLMYFMQEAGEPLKLKYESQTYGPYATNLRHLLRRLENHYTTGYRDGGDAPGKEIELVPGAVQEATRFLASQSETGQRFDRVSHLVEGFESARGLELLATVHWVARRHPDASQQEIVDRTYMWGAHKRLFSPRQIALATETLKSKGWLQATGTNYALNL